jgi:hypothetical protein
MPITMSKAYINSINITKNDKRTLENVTQFVVSNYSTDAVSFTHKNVTRTIPPMNSALDIPVAPFEASAFGQPFDVEIEIAFATGSGGRVILDYTTLKNC